MVLLMEPYGLEMNLSPRMNVLFPKRYALYDPLAIANYCRCNPPYIVRQPIMLQRVDILFHHYQPSDTVSVKGSARTHTHRISKSVHPVSHPIVQIEVCPHSQLRYGASGLSYTEFISSKDPPGYWLCSMDPPRQAAYRLAKMPTHSTLERMEAGIPHLPAGGERSSSCMISWSFELYGDRI